MLSQLLDFDPASPAPAHGRESTAPTTLLPGSRHRRCYGAAVESAVAEVLEDPRQPPNAPRLRELLTQLDADGHNTVALRTELEKLLEWR